MKRASRLAHVVALPPPPPDAKLIALLEGVLERARSGEVVAVGIAEVRKDGMPSSAFGPGDVRLVLAADLLHGRLLRGALDGADRHE